MRKLNPREREELGINRLPMSSVLYINALEAELEKLQKELDMVNRKSSIYKAIILTIAIIVILSRHTGG